MVRAVRPLRSLSMARGCARIDSRLDTVKISLAGRVEVHHARFLAVIGVRKTFPHGLGQNRKNSMRAYDFRFAPKSGHCATESACPFRANNGSRHAHSITSSARRGRDGGIVRPSVLAVLMFTTNSNLVGCSIGMSAGLVPVSTFTTCNACWRLSVTKRGP